MAEARMGKKVNHNELCAIFEITPPTLRDWTAAGCPYVLRGGAGKEWQFDTRQVIEWFTERELSRKGVGTVKGDDRSSLSHRKQLSEVHLREMEVERKAGNLVPIGWFVTVLGDVFGKVNAKLSSISARAAPLVAVETDTKRCQRIIERVVNEAREQLVGPTERSLMQAALDGTGARGATGELPANPRSDGI